MPTQDQPGVNFGIAHDQQTFRLLELPAELLDIITAPNPARLSIKSAETSSRSGTQEDKSSYAVLCTADKTYQIRQVQTSNSVFVAQTYSTTDDNGVPVDGINAIASCTATLELHPVKGSASDYLRSALLLWDGEIGRGNPAKDTKTKQAVFANIPLSDAECQTSWEHICAFECDGHCYEPTPRAMAVLWQDIFDASVAESINVGEMFPVDELWKALDSQTMGSVPRPFLEALLSRLSPNGESIHEGWTRLDQAKTVQWVGTVLLQSYVAGDLLTANFLDLWRNKLPENWRETAQLEIIKDFYSLPTSTTIAWFESADASNSQTTPAKAAPKASTGARKWHEKFKTARK